MMMHMMVRKVLNKVVKTVLILRLMSKSMMKMEIEAGFMDVLMVFPAAVRLVLMFAGG